ncbi:hypothetical protein lerEdw1_016920 [Lerista edwardsae]|nr:hypothetical protein lerEdw1_016920 [Lerista edwardsae]
MSTSRGWSGGNSEWGVHLEAGVSARSLAEETLLRRTLAWVRAGSSHYLPTPGSMALPSPRPVLKGTGYSPLPISGEAVSFQLQESGPVQSHNFSLEEQEEENFLTDPAEKRMQRHADAIFTDHYRKFLSAQKILQGIYGKRLGPGSPRGEKREFLTRRESDSILMDSRYHQEMVLKNFLGAMLQNKKSQDISDDAHLDNFVSVLSKLVEL